MPSYRCACGETEEAKFYPSCAYRCRACNNERARIWKRNNIPRSEQFTLGQDGMKRCRKCSVVKPSTDEFFLVVNGRPTSPCRECWNARRRDSYIPHPRIAKGPDMEKLRAKKRRRRALERGAPVSDFTSVQWQALKVAFAHRCAYCGKRAPLTQDHVIPLSRGGSHTARNIVPACQSCNSRKNNRGAPDYQPVLLLV